MNRHGDRIWQIVVAQVAVTVCHLASRRILGNSRPVKLHAIRRRLDVAWARTDATSARRPELDEDLRVFDQRAPDGRG